MLKGYYLLFFKLYRFFESGAKEGWEHWKALTAICVLQILILLQLLVWYTVLTEKTIKFQKPYWLPITLVIIITVANYYALLHNEKWREYVHVFANQTVKYRRLTSWLSFLFVLAVIGGLVLAFVFLSRMSLHTTTH